MSRPAEGIPEPRHRLGLAALAGRGRETAVGGEDGPCGPDVVGGLAAAWAEAVAGTSYVSMSRSEIEQHLAGLTRQLVTALLAEPFDPTPARQVGAAMVAAHFTGTETLNRTVALLATELPARLGLFRDGCQGPVVERVAAV